MVKIFFQSLRAAAALLLIAASRTFAADAPVFTVGEMEIVATKKQRETLGLNWFIDGNLGVVKHQNQVQLYGANGSKPVRVTGTLQNLLQKVEQVRITSGNKEFRYLSGGPLFRDPQSRRIFLFYHAEIHRGTEKNFYSVLGLSIQTDEHGLEFMDLGPIFTANVSNEQAQSAVAICGAPYMIKDGCFYLYARDVMAEGSPRHSNLSVARAKVAEVVQAGLEGKNAEWKKYYNNHFSEPGLGGRSSPLEEGNPGTRWMDVSYNTAIEKYIMVVAANTGTDKVELFVTWSDDGIAWAERRKLADEDGESFYPSIVGFEDDPRQSGAEFYVYYTFSAKGGWERWSDAAIARRRITVAE